MYFDSSALVKRYVEELGSTEVQALLETHLAATARLTETEVASALARRCREGAFSTIERDRAFASLRRDLRSIYRVELTSAVTRRSLDLLKRYSLRAADAVQLASCLELREQLALPVLFVAFDRRLCEAAAGEDL